MCVRVSIKKLPQVGLDECEDGEVSRKSSGGFNKHV